MGQEIAKQALKAISSVQIKKEALVIGQMDAIKEHMHNSANSVYSLWNK